MDINIVNQQLKFPQVVLKEPIKSGFVLIAVEVDKKASFWQESSAKKKFIKKAKAIGEALECEKYILEITVFKASLFPPGRDGEFLKKEKEHRTIHGEYDVVILIELDSIDNFKQLENNSLFKDLNLAVAENSIYHFTYKAINARRIDTVNHKKQGVFLFNFFIAEDRDQNLGVWEYTAGWFQDQTGLNNSTLFSSVNQEESSYSVINHCRWDSFWNILPSLIFKKTFRTYVLHNFAANNVVAIPILYKLA